MSPSVVISLVLFVGWLTVPSHLYDLLEPLAAPEFFADGLSQVDLLLICGMPVLLALHNLNSALKEINNSMRR